MNKKKLTPLQKEYKHQQQRIKNVQKRLEKKGIFFENQVVPNMPKRVTQKAIQEIAKIKPKNIAPQGRYLNKLTCEVIAGQEALALLKNKPKSNPTFYSDKYKQSRKEPTFTQLVISNYRATISQFPAVAEPILNSWLDQLISEYGIDDVAEMLQTGAENGDIVTYKIAYSRDNLFQYMHNMLEYLPNSGIMFKEQLMDAMEYGEDTEVY